MNICSFARDQPRANLSFPLAGARRKSLSAAPEIYANTRGQVRRKSSSSSSPCDISVSGGSQVGGVYGAGVRARPSTRCDLPPPSQGKENGHGVESVDRVGTYVRRDDDYPVRSFSSSAFFASGLHVSIASTSSLQLAVPVWRSRRLINISVPPCYIRTSDVATCLSRRRQVPFLTGEQRERESRDSRLIIASSRESQRLSLGRPSEMIREERTRLSARPRR